MPLNNVTYMEEKDNVPSNLIDEISLTFDDISIESVMEYYENDDLESLYKYVKNLKLFNFPDVLSVLRKEKDIAPLKGLDDVTMGDVVQKYRELRIAINSVIKIKSYFNDLKLRWDELYNIVKGMYENQRVAIMLKPMVKELSSKELREAKVKEECNMLIKTLTKIEIMIGRFIQVEKEIAETLKHLDDCKSDTSRIQSGIALALDTGEITQVYWKGK